MQSYHGSAPPHDACAALRIWTSDNLTHHTANITGDVNGSTCTYISTFLWWCILGLVSAVDFIAIRVFTCHVAMLQCCNVAMCLTYWPCPTKLDTKLQMIQHCRRTHHHSPCKMLQHRAHCVAHSDTAMMLLPRIHKNAFTHLQRRPLRHLRSNSQKVIASELSYTVVYRFEADAQYLPSLGSANRKKIPAQASMHVWSRDPPITNLPNISKHAKVVWCQVQADCFQIVLTVHVACIHRCPTV